MSYEPAALIAAVQQSPILVAAHDRAAWCSLYAVDGQVNDPVGSRPHTGRAAIERFYDTFIAPNTITFDVHHDMVCGMSVMRDLTIETVMSTGVKLHVPMHLRYDLVDEAGQLKIQRLYAHWELLPMILQLLGTGPKGWWTAIKLGPQLILNQGIGGVIGFMRGFLGVGRRGKRVAGMFLAALHEGDSAAAQSQLEAEATLHWPFGKPQTLARFLSNARGLEWSKVIAAGNCVTATVKWRNGNVESRGVMLLEFRASRDRIAAVQLFAS
jgi:hypothetical protein